MFDYNVVRLYLHIKNTFSPTITMCYTALWAFIILPRSSLFYFVVVDNQMCIVTFRDFHFLM